MPASSQVSAIALCAIAAASLWDFRFHDVRIFDCVSLICVLTLLVCFHRPMHGWLAQRQRYLFLFAIIVAYAAAGYLVLRHRSSLAIVLLAIVGLQLVGRPDALRSARIYQWLIGLHLAAFILQFVAFYGVGVTIDFQAIGGGFSRITQIAHLGGVYIRSSGLFAEPNSYCVNMFVLANLLILIRPSRALVSIVALSMMLSQSLWGIGAALMLVALNEWRSSKTRSAWVGATGLQCLALLVAFNIGLWITKPSVEPQPPLYGRIALIVALKDTSLRDRYIARFPVPAGPAASSCINCRAVVQNTHVLPRTVALLFGEGLSTKYFLDDAPLNGFYFIFKSLGIVGMCLFAASLLFAIRDFAAADKIFVLASFVFSLTTYPLITYVIFWIWLASLLSLPIQGASAAVLAARTTASANPRQPS